MCKAEENDWHVSNAFISPTFRAMYILFFSDGWRESCSCIGIVFCLMPSWSEFEAPHCILIAGYIPTTGPI